MKLKISSTRMLHFYMAIPTNSKLDNIQLHANDRKFCIIQLNTYLTIRRSCKHVSGEKWRWCCSVRTKLPKRGSSRTDLPLTGFEATTFEHRYPTLYHLSYNMTNYELVLVTIAVFLTSWTSSSTSVRVDQYALCSFLG